MLYMTKKGFTLLEVLLTLLIVSSLFLLTLTRTTKTNLDWIEVSNEYLKNLSCSLTRKEENALEYEGKYIRFNEMGRVNKAQTINIGNKNIVIHLGNGYLTHE